MKIGLEPGGWSMESIDWLNFKSFDDILRKPDGTYYKLWTILDQEKTIMHNGRKLTVDGYASTSEGQIFYEYYG